jgi:hypothetical protein
MNPDLKEMYTESLQSKGNKKRCKIGEQERRMKGVEIYTVKQV